MGMMYAMSRITDNGDILAEPIGIRPTLQPFFKNSLFNEYLNRSDIIDLITGYVNSLNHKTYENYIYYTKLVSELSPFFSNVEFDNLNRELVNKIRDIEGDPELEAIISQNGSGNIPNVSKLWEVLKSKIKPEYDAINNYLIPKQIELIKNLKI